MPITLTLRQSNRTQRPENLVPNVYTEKQLYCMHNWDRDIRLFFNYFIVHLSNIKYSFKWNLIYNRLQKIIKPPLHLSKITLDAYQMDWFILKKQKLKVWSQKLIGIRLSSMYPYISKLNKQFWWQYVCGDTPVLANKSSINRPPKATMRTLHS